jgi:chemotaxis protein MotA
MDVATLIGMISGFALVLASIMMGSGLGLFFNLPSLMIVVGGAFGATMINYPLKDVIGVLRVVKHVFQTKTWSAQDVTNRFIALSRKSRKDGVLALESELRGIDDSFLSKGLQMAIDGLPPETIRQIMETEIDYMEDRHRSGAEILSTMASYFPAMGMIGTLIGLVQMLQTMEDPSVIGPSMAVALLTTFYGAVAANLICLPMAGKLRKRSREETLIKEMVICGVLSVALGENPRIMEEKLHSFVPPNQRKKRFR